jgi:hypothetical protein
MSMTEEARGVVDEFVESTELAPGTNGFHLEPRCRVCRNDVVRTKVNNLLANGLVLALPRRSSGSPHMPPRNSARARAPTSGVSCI